MEKKFPMVSEEAGTMILKLHELSCAKADLEARVERYEKALKQFAECHLTNENCASFEVANRRIRNIAKTALLEPGGWVRVQDGLPEDHQRVYAKYEGVYGPRLVSFWRDAVNNHFGAIDERDGKGSLPATHWRPLTKFELVTDLQARGFDTDAFLNRCHKIIDDARAGCFDDPMDADPNFKL